ncbi:hypothetical protein PP614_04810 [Mycobacteroides abscessus]|uniref:hypothetical protein n=1 Tax=Mycobacteroides abscessus TaxID=36809 RepID=UPI00078B6708|nr:hypothetical protein [Mycobacteroides abscessus]QST89364.1 hypothetical protein PROPHIGD51-1_30 [Mycobacterium phage prophiGD51-1]AMU57209.1 hypothetical protein A3O02_20030 [Mycobacteroides abscessus]MBE5434379.1 hypothetical protein [Mycobacteroides abscessus]MBN7444265.1 hypothetical protein [Mycobacteroides abscessus subsp. abscessus]MDM1900124.1 hypothetical protein [Mycobacteroides abscessus]
MTQKTGPERFTCPGLEEGGRVAIQLTDGALIEGYLYDGQLHDEPRKPSPSAYTLDSVFAFRNPLDMWRIRPNRLSAPWRIWPVNREWRIEKRVGDGYETWCRFDTSAEAFAAFAAGSAR